MIEFSRLTATDIGRWVVYLPTRATGRIKSWNHEWVFVVYSADGNWDRFDQYTARECLKNGLRGMNARGELRIHD